MFQVTRRDVLRYGAGAAFALELGRYGMSMALAPDAVTARVRFAWWTGVGRPTPFQVSTTGPGGVVLQTLLYDTLTWKDTEGIIPWLAKTWDVNADGLAYTMRLVDNATWHDGTPLTADDVAFSFDYHAQHPFVWTATDVVASVDVVSPAEVTIHLTQPYAPLLEEIAGSVPTIRRHIWESVDDPVKDARPERLIGSGPFTLADYDQSAGAFRLEAYDGYWRGRTRIDEWQQITIETETQFATLQQGDVDIALSTDASSGRSSRSCARRLVGDRIFRFITPRWRADLVSALHREPDCREDGRTRGPPLRG